MWFLPLFVLVWLSESKSSGIITTSDISQGCDWEAPGVLKAWGCQTRKWNASNDNQFARGFCQDPNFNTGKFMWWTGAPEPASPAMFSMRTGNGDPAKDPKTYVAGRYVSVYIKALQFDTLYKGLLLFAKEDKTTNASKVGDWNVPLEASPQFASYPTHLCPRSVMHVNAEDKPYVVKFNFLAPASGTGTIRIKAMLKTGPPNPTDFGSFLQLPDIILTEAQPNDVRKWVLLNGTSCADYCKANLQPDCNDVALGTSMDGIQPNPLDSIYPCHGALFHDCTGNPRVTLPDRFCTYADSKCPKPTAAKCSVVPDAFTPMFCLCGAPITGAPTVAPTIGGSPTTADPNVLKASSNNLVPGFGALISALFMGSLNGKYSASLGVAALMLAAAPLASAHNWMEGTRGRASNLGANQFCSPAFPQVNRQKVHMQVAVGQPFILEWASAHGDSTYWILIHDNARANVSKLTRSLMDSWLNACPGGGLGNQTGTNRRYHRFRPNKNLQSTGPVNGASASAVTYASLFYPDPIYNGSIWDAFSLNGGRPTTFYQASTGMINCYNGGADTIAGYNCAVGPKTMLANYRESDLASDRRCSYTNSTNPWIHTIHRYAHRDVSDGYATALMSVPDNLPAGRYQLHYKWSSYCDTIDIDVKAKGMTVVNPYGTVVAPKDIEYDVAQHCLFEKPRKVGQCVEVVTTPQQCAALCNTDTNCRGFQLLPLQLDNSNEDAFGLFPESSYIPWTDVTKSNRSSFCEKSQFVNSPSAGPRMVCFTVTQFQDDFNSARPLWTFTDDTNHQGFYGTCYIKPTLRDFGTIATVDEDKHTDFRFLSKCIPCDNIGQDLSNPRWGPQQNYCTDCTKTPATPRQGVKAPQWASTIGPGTFNQTAYWLSPGGSPYAFEDECKLLAMNNPKCSKFVMYSDYRTQRFAGMVNNTKPSDVRLNGNVVLINGTSSWHYSKGTLTHAYFRSCACLDKDVADSLAGANPIIDPTMSALACDGAKLSECVFRNFTIYKLP